MTNENVDLVIQRLDNHQRSIVLLKDALDKIHELIINLNIRLENVEHQLNKEVKKP